MMNLSARDQRVIWHPYTQMKTADLPVPIIRGEGVYLFDDAGNKYIDAISSWWVNLHGHGHPYLAEKLYQQAKKLEHVMFAGFTHEPAIQLAERLLPLLPGRFSKIFYSDNGSTAVEVALKMAIQYWQNRAQGARYKVQGPNSRANAQGSGEFPGIRNQESRAKNQGAAHDSRNKAQVRSETVAKEEVAVRLEPTDGRGDLRHKIIALKNSYHGDTFGSMSISERGIFTLPFNDYLFEVEFIDVPEESNIASLKKRIEQLRAEACCFIYEPLLQGAGGMKMYDATHLNELIKACKHAGIICIADEVMTGFYRTGKMFAGEYVDEKPDIICLSKGITGGMLALGATACTQEIFDAFLSEDRTKTFFHGHSYTGNPLACAVANASLDLLEVGEFRFQIDQIIRLHKTYPTPLAVRTSRFHTKNLRRLGTVLAFELETDEEDAYLNSIGKVIANKALQEGVLLRPLGNTIYFMPPYCISKQELERVYIVTQETLAGL
jgi:adenosylmethionine-8-amino-7-oxononanoate aminotransferase